MKGTGPGDDRDKRGGSGPGAGRVASGRYTGRAGRYGDGRDLGRYHPDSRYGPPDLGGRPTDEQHAGNHSVTQGPTDRLPEGNATGAAGSGTPAWPGAPEPPEQHGTLGVPHARDGRSADRAESAESGDRNVRGPGAPAGPGGPGRRGPGTGGPDDGGFDPDGSGDPAFGADELALGRLLKEAVQDVEPRPGSLDHLRHAVPARRARKRQALVGLVAAAVLLCTAVPAVIHVTRSGGSGGDHTSVAGHGEAVHGGTSGGKDTDGGRQGPGQTGGTTGGADKGSGHGTGDGTDQSGGASSGPDPDRTLAATSPACAATALGNVQSTIGTADADGRVYGSFRVTNVSDSDCTIEGAGTVATVAQGAADPSKINVVDHTAGDPASGLPSPAAEPAQLILQPGAAYEIKFAWVPSETCQPEGGSGGPTADPTPSTGGDSGSDRTEMAPSSSDGSQMSTQLYSEDVTPGEGSVTVSHTADPGAPSATTTIPHACAGTLYRTGLLATS
ncbi:hypothetical protein [Streptomyces odontomachi]|uniref:hypothetical protein n=1 Tax=Streptomyces odontomachi TaxID=2944940 RepID=UPI00210A0BAD|nr:hypothetical protein [Streptomyces sp. ODS25]